MSNDKLKPCPFCGGQPAFTGDAGQWCDWGRYVGLSLGCCAQITQQIGWRRARDMTPSERGAELHATLTEAWNKRNEDEAEKQAGPVAIQAAAPVDEGLEALRKMLQAAVDQLTAAPASAPPSERDKEDAERYRIVRRGQHWSVIDGIGNTLRGSDLDAAIDAIRAARATKEQQ